MNKVNFPDPRIKDLVLAHLDNFIGLKSVSVEPKFDPVFKYNFCKFLFQGQMTTLWISLVERTWSNVYGLSILIVRDTHKHFSFADYLDFINSSHELKEIESNPDLDNYASIEAQLLLLKKHLNTDLKKIFTDNEWIDVPFERD